MSSLRLIPTTSIIALGMCVFVAPAQSQESGTITPDQARKTVRGVIAKVEELYVIDEKVPEFIAALEESIYAGRYDVTDVETLVGRLDEDVRMISGDRHINFWYDPDLNRTISAEADDSEENSELAAEYSAQALADNFGLAGVTRLSGNIGYLDFRNFWDEVPGAEEKVRAAMELLHGSSAVIIDLRKNGGGSPWEGRLIQSYFFDTPTLVWRFYNREEDSVTEGWTASPVPEKSLNRVPLYLLTSGRTASAAEAFAYSVKVFKIGIVVGRRTVGAAHRTSIHPIGEDFMLRISVAAPVSPITGGNWEGTGVEPDIETDAEDALLVAQIHALETLKKERSSEEGVFDLDWALMEVRAGLSPPQLSERQLEQLVGTYGNRRITYEEGHLVYQLRDRGKVRLIPLSESVFQHPFREYYRVRFLKKGSRTVAMEGLYDDGRVSRYEKDGS